MVYVDKIFYWPGKGEWCHMWADTERELHGMARRIGLKRGWFQPSNRSWKMDHYDLRASKRALAIRHGAQEKSLRDVIRGNMHLTKGGGRCAT